MKRKAPDEDIQPVIERIHTTAMGLDLDPVVAATDVFTTAVLWVGSKSLSHVLACIERTKERLLDAGAASEASRDQIITAVMQYWGAHPGVAICIVEKLLNYSILSPAAVVRWALVTNTAATHGEGLAYTYVYELVFNTVVKVTGRVRQVVANSRPKPQEQLSKALPSANGAAAAPAVAGDAMVVDGADAAPATTDTEPPAAAPPPVKDEATVAAEAAAAAAARAAEVKAMRVLFFQLQNELEAWTAHDAAAATEQSEMVARWAKRWLRVFSRRAAIEEAFLLDVGKARASHGGGENGSSGNGVQNGA